MWMMLSQRTGPMNSNLSETDFAWCWSVPQFVYLAVTHPVRNILVLMFICGTWNLLPRDGGFIQTTQIKVRQQQWDFNWTVMKVINIGMWLTVLIVCCTDVWMTDDVSVKSYDLVLMLFFAYLFIQLHIFYWFIIWHACQNMWPCVDMFLLLVYYIFYNIFYNTYCILYIYIILY